MRKQAESIDSAAVLSKAVLRAADMLGLRGKELAEILGVSKASVSRMGCGDHVISQDSKEWELALLLVRLFRGIDAIAAGDDQTRIGWMRNRNIDLDGIPRQLIKTIPGLVQTVDYVDAFRARI